AGAEAPAIATVLADAPLLEAPDAGAAVIRTVPEGADVELTGTNAVGFLQVRAGDDTGWMSTDVLSISAHRPVSTAVTPNGAAIYDAPMPDAGVLGEVPAGGVVILTGAHVDTWVAGSYQGVGGWIVEADLDVPYDADGTAR
ncbi:MAG: SH3 domain-containing protein, partial [Chloroflexota bacterium]